MNTFFELLQMAVGRRTGLSVSSMSREDWEELCKLVSKHNLLGVTFPVIDNLHDTMEGMPLNVYTRWALVKERIEKKNDLMLVYCRQLYSQLKDDGFSCCLLKGLSAAALYPEPRLRQSGDIDIWVGGTRQATVDYLKQRYKVRNVVYHHCDASVFPKIGVEVHFTPTWMNSPIANRRLQKWFDGISEEQFSNYDQELGITIPTTRFQAVYMLLHIYRHVLDEGVGLRQLLDYYYLLINLERDVRARVLDDLRKLKLLGFAAAVMYVLQEVFLLKDDELLVAPDKKEGRFLLEEILISGNFGRFDPRNAHQKNEPRIKHASRKLRRAMRFLCYYPSEVICMPLFMFWQYFWRRKHNYLYRG